jgi:hypothetical protein
MDGYLVVQTFLMDDLPIKLFADRQAALDFANTLGDQPPDDILVLWHRDIGTPAICTKLVQFQNGEPVKVEVAVDFDKD